MPTPAFSDSFTGGAKAPTSAGWGWKSSATSQLVTAAAYDGTHSMKFYWPATPAAETGNNPPLREERFVLPAGVTEAWFEKWVLLPENWNHRRTAHLDPGGPDNNKFFAVWADQYATTGHAQLVLEYDADSTYYGQTSKVKAVLRNEQGITENDPAFKLAPIIVPEQVGVWTRYRVHVRLSSGAGVADGRARLWRGDTLVWDTGNFVWWEPGGYNFFREGYLFGACNSGFDEDTTVYLDAFSMGEGDPGWTFDGGEEPPPPPPDPDPPEGCEEIIYHTQYRTGGGEPVTLKTGLVGLSDPTAWEGVPEGSHEVRVGAYTATRATRRWSDWRAVVVEGAATPGTPPVGPAIVSAEELAPGEITLTGEAPRLADGTTHDARRWQGATDSGFTDLIEDGWSATDLLTHVVSTGGLPTVSYWRIRDRDSTTAESEWGPTFVLHLAGWFTDFSDAAAGAQPSYITPTKHSADGADAATATVRNAPGSTRGKVLELYGYRAAPLGTADPGQAPDITVAETLAAFTTPGILSGAVVYEQRFRIFHKHRSGDTADTLSFLGGAGLRWTPDGAGYVAGVNFGYLSVWWVRSGRLGSLGFQVSTPITGNLQDGHWYRLRVVTYDQVVDYPLLSNHPADNYAPFPVFTVALVDDATGVAVASLLAGHVATSWMDFYDLPPLSGQYGPVYVQHEGRMEVDWIAVGQGVDATTDLVCTYPGEILAPIYGEPFDASLVVKCRQAISPTGAAVQYRTEVRDGSGAWAELHAAAEITPVAGVVEFPAVDTSLWAASDAWQVQVYASDDGGATWSGPVASQRFRVEHEAEPSAVLERFVGTAAGQIPAAWASLWGGPGANMRVQDAPASTDGANLVQAVSASGALGLEGFGQRKTVRVWLRGRLNAIQSALGLVLRASNPINGLYRDALMGQLDHHSSTARIRTREEATESNAWSAAETVVLGAYYYADFEAEDTGLGSATLRFRAWRGDEPTPTGWEVELVSSAVDAYGLVGIFAGSGAVGIGQARREVDAFGYSVALAPAEPAPPEWTPSRPCAVVHEVYETDGETVAWSVSDDATHPHPYLKLPAHYGEQQVDFAAGASKIGQATAVIVDAPTIPGDQDSGYVTHKLAVGGKTAVKGRRQRMRRWIDEVTGWVTIVDGPGDSPRFDGKLTTYALPVRDWREKERKIKAFVSGGTTTVFPRGTLNAWGDKGDGTYLSPAATPLVGVVESAGDGINATISFDAQWTSEPYLPDGYMSPVVVTWVPPELVVTDAQAEALRASPPEPYDGGFVFDLFWRFKKVKVLWRVEGSGAAWTEVFPNARLGNLNIGGGPSAHPEPSLIVTDTVAVGAVDGPEAVGLHKIVLTDMEGTGTVPTVNGQSVEVVIVYVGEPTEYYPYHYEGTLGGLLAELYDGEHSERADLDGDGVAEVVPPGIRYDPAALAAMTDPVLLRVTEPWEDVRTDAEKYLYAPAGYAPALDNDGRIAPVSQEIPADVSGVLVVDDSVAVDGPDYAHGDRLVNLLRFAYPRVYSIPADSDPFMEGSTGDGLAVREVEVVYRDEESIRDNGDTPLPLDGRAFCAIGTPQEEDAAGGDPLTSIADEQGYQFAADRKLYVFDRHKRGTPVYPLKCRRSATASARVGDWVRVTVSWLPDYDTGRRGLDRLAQIVGIKDLDCAWRELTLEDAGPFPGA